MTDQLNGLRFDIYERVHLPDDVAAIDELEEIELVPHMQALPQDDQVLLRGHLLLSGIYRSQDRAEVNQLEHWIPVEISLPLNRIQSVDELAVEIDNFDVDLLTTRSLNVTGVLALRGLQIQAEQSPIWRDDSFTVVHQAQTEAEEQQQRYLQLEDNELEEEVDLLTTSDYEKTIGAQFIEQERDDDWNLQAETDALTTEASKESNWLSMFQNLEESRKEGAVFAQTHSQLPLQREATEFDSTQWGDVSKERNVEAEMNLDPVLQLETELAPIIPEVEEKPDVRVALGGKPLESIATQPQQFGVGLLSQLGDKGAKREAELRIQEAAKAEEVQNNESHSSGDELEWTRLFLNNGKQEQSFRKVKMCIVQREETLDLIANRYNVQPRELQLFNRMHEPYLSEGQVLYIP
ncbi:LysM peptidoglycan-binding domain-containing protein [Cohnella sp. WQ 127256]|uniref:LysM peptidoglycan-binding domain-containing protein n=1 Tax=Cohnella sp. WQ 127256 TaxID=2938790 RepID=UPI0021186FD2